MKAAIYLIASVLGLGYLILGWSVVEGFAGDRHVRRQAVHVQQAQSAPVAFAVPVGVPVAVVNTSQGLYSVGGYANQYDANRGDAEPFDLGASEAELELLREFLEFKKARAQATAKAASLVAQTCASCHKPGGKGLELSGIDLTGELDAATRLASIQAVTNGSMPKGGKLDPNQIGKLIQELSASPKAAILKSGAAVQSKDVSQPSSNKE